MVLNPEYFVISPFDFGISSSNPKDVKSSQKSHRSVLNDNFFDSDGFEPATTVAGSKPERKITNDDFNF